MKVCSCFTKFLKIYEKICQKGFPYSVFFILFLGNAFNAFIYTFQKQIPIKYLKRNMHYELNILKSFVDDMDLILIFCCEKIYILPSFFIIVQ